MIFHKILEVLLIAHLMDCIEGNRGRSFPLMSYVIDIRPM